MSVDLKIHKIPTDKDKIPTTPLMKRHVIPSHPMRLMFSGESGSGKTNAMINLMTRLEFYKNYFDKIYYFNPTYDTLGKKLNLPKEQIFHTLDPADLESIINDQDELIKDKGIAASPRILLIFDDVIQDTKYLNSKVFKKVYFAGRHSNISSMIMAQSYNQVPRKLRLQMSNLFIFPAKNSELRLIQEEFTPAGMSKKEFLGIMSKATAERFNFLHINLSAPPDQRFRKNLDEILRPAKA